MIGRVHEGGPSRQGQHRKGRRLWNVGPRSSRVYNHKRNEGEGESPVKKERVSIPLKKSYACEPERCPEGHRSIAQEQWERSGREEKNVHVERYEAQGGN